MDAIEFGSFGSFGIGSEITTHSDVYSDKLDLFSIAPTEKQMLYFRESRVFPMAGVNNVGPFSFQIPAMSSYFLDAGSIKVEGEIAIYERSTDGTEKKIDEGAKLIPVNMLPGESSFQKVLQRSIKRGARFQRPDGARRWNSRNQGPTFQSIHVHLFYIHWQFHFCCFSVALWNNIEVSINGLMVSFVSSPIANYKAYLETILSYNELAAKTHLIGSRFLMDEAGDFSKTAAKTGGNQEKRMKWFEKSNSVDFSFPLASDILRIDKYLMDRVALDIKLSRVSDEFLIVQDKTDTKNYFIKIEKLSLVVRHIGLDPQFVEYVNKQLDQGKRARYPLMRTVLKSRIIQKGESYTPIVDIFSGRLPSSIYFGFVKNSAFKGNKNENPFDFQHFDIGSISLLVNSRTYPSTRYTPKFTDDVNTSKIMREYMGLMQNIGASGNNEAPLVTLENFHSGCTIFGFDLSPDNCGNYHVHGDERGTMNIELQWSTPTTEPLSLIVYGVFHDEMQLDLDRIGKSCLSIPPHVYVHVFLFQHIQQVVYKGKNGFRRCH